LGPADESIKKSSLFRFLAFLFIALWVVIFILLGFYLLGKLEFHHDDELPKNDFDIPYISIPKLSLAIDSLSFAVYMIPGTWERH
jgi:thiol:disulfide interchange protein DsbD